MTIIFSAILIIFKQFINVYEYTLDYFEVAAFELEMVSQQNVANFALKIQILFHVIK